MTLRSSKRRSLAPLTSSALEVVYKGQQACPAGVLSAWHGATATGRGSG